MRKLFRTIVAGVGLLAGSIVAPAMAADTSKIGVVVPTLDAQFWNSYVDFMRKGAGELGVDLVVLNADNKPDQMIKSIEDLVAQGVDGIIYTPYWATAVPGLTMAAQSNIPVILTDTYADFPPQDARFPNYIAFIGPSDRDAGKQMAEALFAAIKPADDGKKYIAVVNGTAALQSPSTAAPVFRMRLMPIRTSSWSARWTAISSATPPRRSSRASGRAIPTSPASGRRTAAPRPA